MIIWQQGWSLRKAKAHVVRAALQAHDGNRTLVAEELQIALRTLRNMINREPELAEFRHIRGRCDSPVCSSCRRLDVNYDTKWSLVK